MLEENLSLCASQPLRKREVEAEMVSNHILSYGVGADTSVFIAPLRGLNYHATNP